MKLLGYARVKGVKNEKPYDFFQLFMEERYDNLGPNSGGSIIAFSWSRDKGNVIPTVSHDVFLSAMNNGMSIGSDIEIVHDLRGNTRIIINSSGKETPFTDVK